MTRFGKLGAVILAASFAAGPALGAGATAEQNDLRDFRIGMTVPELPEQGYGNFACADGGAGTDKALEAWGDYMQCPADEDGLREIRFDYVATRVEFVKANDKWEGTRVYGHPAIVSLLIDEDGVVQGIRIMTDPEARRYMRKKAYLLGKQAKFHFSPATWQCEELEPASGEEPVGKIFVKERCLNRFDDRVVKLEIDLFRTPEQPMDDFTNATRIDIRGQD